MSILETTRQLAEVQAANPKDRDGVGFNNADFPIGLVLSAVGDEKACAALLYLYPRQSDISREDLAKYLPELNRAAAREILNQARNTFQGQIGFVETTDGVIFNGSRLDASTIKAFQKVGAERTTTGWKIKKSRLAQLKGDLGNLLINGDKLDRIIQANEQETVKPVVMRSVITFTVDGSTLGWTYTRDPLFTTVKDAVKAFGPRYNGNGGWELKPGTLPVIALTLAEMNLPGVDLTALEPYMTATPEVMALREEILTNSLRVRVTKVGNSVKLVIRKYDQALIDACRNAAGRYDGEGWTVALEELPAIAASLSKYAYYDLSALEPLLPSEEEFAAKVEDKNIAKTPTGITLFNHQVEDVAFLLRPARIAKGSSKLLANDMGTGKQAPVSEPVLTPAGWVTMGALKLGDFVIGSNGTPIEVTGVFPQDSREVWEVLFSDGVIVRCGPEHLWTVRDYNMVYKNRGWVTRTARELQDMGLQYKNGVPKFETPQFNGVQGGASPEIDPWLLGQAIGNGSLSHGPINISSSALDVDVVSRLLSLGGVDGGTYGGTHRVRFNITSNNKFHTYIKNIHLDINSKDKFIPEACLFWSWDARVQLLQGLMDSDGSNRKNRVAFHTCSRQLAYNVAALVRSLGGAVVTHEYDRSHQNKPTEWSLNIHTPFCPFSSLRKSQVWTVDSRQRGNRIVSMKRVADEDCVCIRVKSDDHLYVTTGYKLTHNTLSAIIAADTMYPQGRFLIVVPAVAKLNWAKEIRRFIGSTEKIQVVNGRTALIDQSARWTIINYDIIAYYQDVLMASKYDIAVLDECHNIKNLNAKRSGALIPTWNQELHKMEPGILSNVGTVWTMTGTFIMNRMKELFTTLRAVDHKLGKSKRKYEERYCDGHMITVYGGRQVWEAKGASNLPELAQTLAPIYRKVMKKDVLDLPQKLRDDFQVEVSAKALQEIRFVEDQLAETLENMDEDTTILPFITKLKMLTAKAKVEATIEEAEAVLESGDKVIIFTEYTETLQAFVKHFGEQAVYIDGSVTGTKRETMIEAFQGNANIRVMVGNIRACGVAITLTAANHAIFNDKPWNPALAAQAEDRCIAKGQLVMTSKGFRPIETVKVGDQVLTHVGNFKPIRATTSHQHRGLMTEITYTRFHTPLKCTHDHKVFAEKGGKLGWVEAHTLLPGDFMVFPRVQTSEDMDYIALPENLRHDPTQVNQFGYKQKNGRYTPLLGLPLSSEMLFAMGWYVAEGFASIRKGKGSFISFSGHTKELPTLENIRDTFIPLGFKGSIYHSKTSKAVELRIYSLELAEWFHELFGGDAHHKSIPEFIQALPIARLSIFLQAYLSGDGYYRNHQQEWTTVSHSLASQMALLVAKCGNSPTLRYVTEGRQYPAWFGAYTEGGTPSNKALLHQDTSYVYHPITQVTTYTAKREEASRVYDLSVEDDHSFVVGLASVHNCYRIGQTKTVNIVYMTAPDTYDAELSMKLLEKSTLVTDWESMTDAEVKAMADSKGETQGILEYLHNRKKSLSKVS